MAVLDATLAKPSRVEPDYRLDHKGSGDWEAWGPDLGSLADAIADWKQQLSGIDRPWLCWNVYDRISHIQQQIVLEFGWTPVVGCDPLVDPPALVPGAKPFDANRLLQLPTMWMWFPIEFTFQFAAKLAFWHSDFLVSRRDMEHLVRTFDELDDGETAAYLPRRWWTRKAEPCPGLAACATRGGSRHQWEKGCGWWRWFAKHPNFQGTFQPQGDNWDHGYGIRYWRKHCGGCVKPVHPSDRGHCNVPWSKWKGQMSKAESIQTYHRLDALIESLDIADLDQL